MGDWGVYGDILLWYIYKGVFHQGICKVGIYILKCFTGVYIIGYFIRVYKMYIIMIFI